MDKDRRIVGFVHERAMQIRAVVLEIEFLIRESDEASRKEVLRAIACIAANPRGAYALSRLKHRLTRALLVRGPLTLCHQTEELS